MAETAALVVDEVLPRQMMRQWVLNVPYQLHGASVTYRIELGPRQDRKVFTLQTIPATAWCGTS
jgi:hypothetical protein